MKPEAYEMEHDVAAYDKAVAEDDGTRITRSQMRTGLGGFIAMPVTVPANMVGALVINAPLAAAIAYLRGYDLQDPHVRTVATLIAVGPNAQ